MVVGAVVLVWMILFGVFLVFCGNRNLRMRTTGPTGSTGMSRSVEEHIQIERDDLPTYEEIDNFPVIM